MTQSTKLTPRQIAQELEDELRAHLDENPNPWLPSVFEISLELEQFKWLLSHFVDANTKKSLPLDTEFFTVKMGNYIVGVSLEENSIEPN